MAKEVTESTENVDKESAENRTVFLAGKFKDALKSSRLVEIQMFLVSDAEIHAVNQKRVLVF